MKLVGIIGAGGFGKEVMQLAEQMFSGDERLVFVVEDGYAAPPDLDGHPVMRLGEFCAAPASERVFSIAIASSAARERIASSIPRTTAVPFTVAAQAHVSFRHNELGEGAILCTHSHITTHTKIGRFFNLNYHSYVAHDCVIGDFVTFAPGVCCNGHVVIEDHAYIGSGAVIKDGTKRPIVIGRGAVVGMGAVVTRSVPAGATVVGNPARLIARRSET